MIQLEHPVYLESCQRLVIRRLDSLVINITNYENNQSILNRRRSSSQHRLRGFCKLLCRQLRIKAIGRWLQGSRPYLDKLKSTACLHRWTVRQPHTRQRQRRQNTPPSPTCLTNALHATQSEDSTSSFLFVAVVLFPLATTHTNNMSKIYHITRPSLYVKHYWVCADNWKDACKNIDNDKAHHESYDLIYHKAGYKSVSVTDSFGTFQLPTHITARTK